MKAPPAGECPLIVTIPSPLRSPTVAASLGSVTVNPSVVRNPSPRSDSIS
jgi:hypothetical protein